MTFDVYATGWIETWPLKDQTRERYRGILRRELLREFSGYPLAKIHPHHVREWVARQNAARCQLAASASTSLFSVAASKQRRSTVKSASSRCSASRCPAATPASPPS